VSATSSVSDRFMVAMHLMRDAFQVLKEDASWGAYHEENGQFYDGYAEVKRLFEELLGSALVPARDHGLTWAELRTLNLMVTHMTFPEMAAKVFVSANTIRSQASAVYRKLGVHSRHEAITRGRELGLLR